MTDTETKAKKLFTALLRQRLAGVNFMIKEYGNSWEVIGVAWDDNSGHPTLKKFNVVFYKSDEEFFSIGLHSRGAYKAMNIDVSSDINEQATWLLEWVTGDQPCTTKKPKK